MPYLQAREFANELRASTKASRNPTVWLEGSMGSNQSVNSADTSTVSDAYSKMLTIFIPLLVDEVLSTFFFLWNICIYLVNVALTSNIKSFVSFFPNAEFFLCSLHVL